MTIFEEAQAVIGQHQQHSLETIAEFWMLYISKKHNVMVPLDYTDVANLQALLKLARLMDRPDHQDSQRGIIGYIGLVNRIQREEAHLRDSS
jgi:cephalosporin-C deacetylase-like acetyl esterase